MAEPNTKSRSRGSKSKKLKGAGNTANDFIFGKFLQLREHARLKNNLNALFCYNRILTSLSKYPLPILNAHQALKLDGIGPKMAALIGTLLKERYEENEKEKNEQERNHNNESMSRYDDDNEDGGGEGGGGNNDDDDDNSNLLRYANVYSKETNSISRGSSNSGSNNPNSNSLFSIMENITDIASDDDEKKSQSQLLKKFKRLKEDAGIQDLDKPDLKRIKEDPSTNSNAMANSSLFQRLTKARDEAMGTCRGSNTYTGGNNGGGGGNYSGSGGGGSNNSGGGGSGAYNAGRAYKASGDSGSITDNGNMCNDAGDTSNDDSGYSDASDNDDDNDDNDDNDDDEKRENDSALNGNSRHNDDNHGKKKDDVHKTNTTLNGGDIDSASDNATTVLQNGKNDSRSAHNTSAYSGRDGGASTVIQPRINNENTTVILSSGRFPTPHIGALSVPTFTHNLTSENLPVYNAGIYTDHPGATAVPIEGITVIKGSKYRPDKDTNPYFILIGLYKYQIDRLKNYANKKQIRASYRAYRDMFNSREDISSFISLQTLLKHGFINGFKFQDGEKYCLTREGHELAKEFYTERIEAREKRREEVARLDAAKGLAEENVLMAVENQPKKQVNAITAPDPLAKIESHSLFQGSTYSKYKTNRSLEEKSTYKDFDDDCVSVYTIPFEKIKAFNKPREVLTEISTTVSIPGGGGSKTSSGSSITGVSVGVNTDETLGNYGTNLVPIVCDDLEPIEGGYIPIKIKKTQVKKYEVVLYLDNREIKNQKSRNFFYDKLIQNGIKTEVTNLPIGDFLWVIKLTDHEGEKTCVLDYVVERKKADDLASSILDGRYNQQKFRLSDCKLTNVFYIVEGKLTNRAILPQTAINSAIITTQIINKFKVRMTDTINQTLKYVIRLTMVIEAKILQMFQDKSRDYIQFKYDYDGFYKKTSKSHMTMNILFGNMLRNIKGCGKDAVNKIIEKYPTIGLFYKALNKLPDNETRLELLVSKKKTMKSKFFLVDEELEPVGLNKNIANVIIHIFCDKSYPKVTSGDKNKSGITKI